MAKVEEKTSGEKYWITLVRVIAFIIGFLPFVPNSRFYLGLTDKKVPIDASDFFFVLIGFIMLWGSRNFGTWANTLGKSIVDKVKKE